MKKLLQRFHNAYEALVVLMIVGVAAVLLYALYAAMGGGGLWRTLGSVRGHGRVAIHADGAIAVGCHQPGDALQRSQILEVDVVDLDAEVEVLLELEEQFDKLKGIQNAGLEQIGIRGRDFDVKALGEYCAEAFDDCITICHLLFLSDVVPTLA